MKDGEMAWRLSWRRGWCRMASPGYSGIVRASPGGACQGGEPVADTVPDGAQMV